MIDIVCPSCQARYRLPDGAIGENGRKVSCSACGHSWVAHPEPEEEAPLTLGPEAIAAPAPAAASPGPAGPAAPPPQAGGGDRFSDYDADAVRSGASPYADEEDRGMAAYEAFARQQQKLEDEDTEDGAAGPARPGAGAGDDDGEEAPAAGPQRQEDLVGDRSAQMAQIRSMLNEIKQTPGAAPAPEPEESEEDDYRPPVRPSATERALREVDEEERDPLRAKLDQYARPGGSDPNTRYTRQKILKKHAKKVRRRKLEEKRGSGTFLTGFLLIVLVVSIMASVYLLHPLIIERVPESEPAIRDYVATMDTFRAWAGEQIAMVQTTVQDIIADE